jgi:hypothetical protein
VMVYLPSSGCNVERRFGNMKFLKPCQRSENEDVRFGGLVLMHLR